MIKLNYVAGATPLDPNEIEGLIPTHIRTQEELNEWEQANILNAESWAFFTKHQEILTSDFIKRVHKKMFDRTWRWAGKFRNTNKNIGKDYTIISVELKKLLDDTDYQMAHHTYLDDEVAYRFHHRLVAIHPFPNGNGRHARLITNILLTHLGQPSFSWGNTKFASAELARKQYIKALQEADKHDYTLLSQFVRS